MVLDESRLSAIIEGERSFYDDTVEFRSDDRFRMGTGDFILTQIEPDMHVLDIGCGSGNTLIRGADSFAYGLGIDNDPEHLNMAESRLRESGTHNIAFRQIDFESMTDEIKSESFDLVFSQRGPLDSEPTIRAAIEILKPDGLLFAEVIGKEHHREVGRFFKIPEDPERMTVEQTRTAMAQGGVDVRMVADMFSKRIYPNVYAWFQFQCNIWGWLGMSLPEPDDPRIRLFAEHNTDAKGEIETTHHVTWIGGVKRQ